MQNKYVGDVGDFANNGLLRWLCGKPELEKADEDSPEGKLKLGVVWYLYHDDERAGGRTDYLKKPERFRDCDPKLYKFLGQLVKNGNRNIKAIQQGEILPKGTAYYAKCRCSYAGHEEWLRCALSATDEAELVFVNPDNGIAKEAEPPCTKDSSKHVYTNDLKRFVKRGQSLVIYQHTVRNKGKALKQIQCFSHRLRLELGVPDIRVHALWYRAEVARLYFIVVQPGKHQHIIEERLRKFYSSEWCKKKRKLFCWI